MSPLTSIARRGLLSVLAGAALLGAAPAAASAHDAIRLRFQKACPDTTCTGTLLTRAGTPVRGSSVSASVSPLWSVSGVIGFSATETISSRRGAFTMNHLGVNDTDADPPAIRVLGVVVSGSWDGVPLTGALVRIRAFGVPPSSVRGTLVIQPSSDDA